MHNTKTVLIGSAVLPPLPLPLANDAGSQLVALAPQTQRAAPGVRVLAGSFLDAARIDTAVHGARLVVYAPRSWRAWVPAWFDRGLRYTLLAAGWAGTPALVVVPPPVVSRRLLRVASAWLQGRLVRRAARTLQGHTIDWRIVIDAQQALMKAEEPAGAALAASPGRGAGGWRTSSLCARKAQIAAMRRERRSEVRRSA